MTEECPHGGHRSQRPHLRNWSRRDTGQRTEERESPDGEHCHVLKAHSQGKVRHWSQVREREEWREVHMARSSYGTRSNKPPTPDSTDRQVHLQGSTASSCNHHVCYKGDLPFPRWPNQPMKLTYNVSWICRVKARYGCELVQTENSLCMCTSLRPEQQPLRFTHCKLKCL